jgi:hypothetical protein
VKRNKPSSKACVCVCVCAYESKSTWYLNTWLDFTQLAAKNIYGMERGDDQLLQEPVARGCEAPLSGHLCS